MPRRARCAERREFSPPIRCRHATPSSARRDDSRARFSVDAERAAHAPFSAAADVFRERADAA